MEEEEEEKEDTQSTEPACTQRDVDDLSFFNTQGCRARTTMLVQNVK